MIRDLVYFPDPRLRFKAKKVSGTSKRNVPGLVQDLIDTCRANFGYGLAAPQIGVPLRVFVVADNPARGDGFRAYVNPEIVYWEGEEYDLEGCLSFPGAYRVNIERATYVKMRFDGGTAEATDLYARAIQHEIDHLDGVLIVDYEEAIAKAAATEEAGTQSGLL